MPSQYPFSSIIRNKLLPTDKIIVTGIDQDKCLHTDQVKIVYAIFGDGTFLTVDGCLFSEASVTKLLIYSQTLNFALTPKAKKILDSMSTGSLERFQTEPE